MANYKWLELNKVVKRLSDGASIPNDPGNKDWQQFQTDGGTADPADPPPSAADILAALRAGAVEQLLNDTSSNAKAIRAVLLTILDENNLLRQWLEAFKATTALATTLADLKTRVAALPAMPDRTPAQGKTSVQNKLNSGPAD